MDSLDEKFAALSHRTRRSIIAHLALGEATVSELVDHFDLAQPTISSHLKKLQYAGLISQNRCGKKRPCKLDLDGLKVINDWLACFSIDPESKS